MFRSKAVTVVCLSKSWGASHRFYGKWESTCRHGDARDKRAPQCQDSRGLRVPEGLSRFRAAGTLVPCRYGRVAGVRVEPTDDGRTSPKKPPLPSHTGV